MKREGFAQKWIEACKEVPKYCAVCKSSEKLRKCGKCLRMLYCSEAHQRQHWKEHKKTCKPLMNEDDFVDFSSSEITALTKDLFEKCPEAAAKGWKKGHMDQRKEDARSGQLAAEGHPQEYIDHVAAGGSDKRYVKNAMKEWDRRAKDTTYPKRPELPDDGIKEHLRTLAVTQKKFMELPILRNWFASQGIELGDMNNLSNEMLYELCKDGNFGI